ncbi:MAG TPA: hypothetical protein VNU95_16520 [Candidatus Acidoferrales bacterium]|jgi:hypothetical protein|nr:hypothetical protein [Candidatus Acidoferrales bacterium]
MKRWIAYVFLACGLIALIAAGFFGCTYLDIGASKKQMDDAKKYMDSLKDKDIQVWIQRAQADLKKADPNGFTNREVPPDLQQLGITGIEEQSNEVDYVWFGGMDDTALDFVLASNGNFQVFAVYTPYSNRMIWPRQ